MGGRLAIVGGVVGGIAVLWFLMWFWYEVLESADAFWDVFGNVMAVLIGACVLFAIGAWVVNG